VGNSIPVYTTFEFTEVPDWTTVSLEKIRQLEVVVSDISLVDQETAPKLSARIRNNSLFVIPEVSVVAVLYDQNRNAVSVSSTYLENFVSEEEREISFTWPEGIAGEVVAIEVIPLYNIFSVRLK
jgi:hypothetical protein